MAARGDSQRRGGGGGGGRPFVHHQRGGPPIHTKPAPPVDREKTCPLLLRVFTKVGGHHSQADFAVRGKEPKDEVQIYTWMDATLRELTDLADIHFAYPGSRTRDHVFDGSLRPWLGDLVEATKKGLDCQVKEVAPEARRRDALLSFAFVYPTKTGHFTVKEVGKTFSYPNARQPDDGTKALGNLSFEIGDYLDVAIL